MQFNFKTMLLPVAAMVCSQGVASQQNKQKQQPIVWL
jgi:hypothetical protein